MSKELAKKEASEVSTQVMKPGTEHIINSDVVIPKLLLMQALSDYVVARKAQSGDMVRSTTGEKLGDDKKPVTVIPLTFKNGWIIQEKVGQKFEYRKTLPRNAGLDDAGKTEEDKTGETLPWDFRHRGTEWRRVKTIDVFCLLPADVQAELAEIKKFTDTGEMPDLNKTLLPVVVSFRSTSYNAGKSVVTHFAKAAGMAKYGVKPYNFTLELSCKAEKNDLGSYFVFEAKQGGKVPADQVKRAEEWYSLLANKNVRVDEAAEEASTVKTGSPDVEGDDQF